MEEPQIIRDNEADQKEIKKMGDKLTGAAIVGGAIFGGLYGFMLPADAAATFLLTSAGIGAGMIGGGVVARAYQYFAVPVAFNIKHSKEGYIEDEASALHRLIRTPIVAAINHIKHCWAYDMQEIKKDASRVTNLFGSKSPEQAQPPESTQPAAPLWEPPQEKEHLKALKLRAIPTPQPQEQPTEPTPQPSEDASKDKTSMPAHPGASSGSSVGGNGKNGM